MKTNINLQKAVYCIHSWKANKLWKDVFHSSLTPMMVSTSSFTENKPQGKRLISKSLPFIIKGKSGKLLASYFTIS